MLNSTLTATERTLCCILENYQKEGGLEVPKVLRAYMGGIEFLPFKQPMDGKQAAADKLRSGSKVASTSGSKVLFASAFTFGFCKKTLIINLTILNFCISGAWNIACFQATIFTVGSWACQADLAWWRKMDGYDNRTHVTIITKKSMLPEIQLNPYVQYLLVYLLLPTVWCASVMFCVWIVRNRLNICPTARTDASLCPYGCLCPYRRLFPMSVPSRDALSTCLDTQLINTKDSSSIHCFTSRLHSNMNYISPLIVCLYTDRKSVV